MKSKYASRFSVHPGLRLLLADMGISPAEVLSFAGLPADLLARKDAWLAPAEYFRLWHGMEAADASGNIALTLGRAISVEAFDPVIFASLSSPNLNVALSRIAEYKRLIGPLMADVRVGPKHTELAFKCYGYDRPLPSSLGAAEIVFFTQLARLATRFNVQPIRCELVTLPSQRQNYEAFLGCKLQAGASNSIRFSVEDATRPFLTENMAMWEFFEPSLRARLSKLDADATISDRVRGALLDMLPSGQSSIAEVARRLAISQRSLQRRLELDDVQYRELLSNVRRDLACHYLVNSDQAPGEISYLLGFEDPNSFLRAFKTWTGRTPGEFRVAPPLTHVASRSINSATELNRA